ncbi:PsbP-related protein [Paenibacillus lautus]|uniref:PsbP-related protein n=1 Tax=Paenibacillus lautus TaxID=1401 RepID=UPI003D2C94E0
MKRLAKSTLFILLLLVMLTACSSGKDTTETSSTPSTPENEVAKNAASENTEKNEEPNKTQPYKGENFSFSYPSTWKDAELNIPQVIAAFVNPNPQGAFVDNLNVVIEESSATPEDAANVAVQGLTNGDGGPLIQNFKKLNYIDVPKKAAGILESEYTHGESNAQVILTQYFVSNGNELYTLSISYSKTAYDNGGKAIVHNIMDSFEIVKVSHQVEEANANAGSNVEGLTEENLFAEIMAYVIPIEIEGGALDELTYNYFVQHYELFPALTPKTQKRAKAEVDPNITSRHLNKNLNPYLDQMIEVSGYVVDIIEDEVEEGITLAEIHIIDDNDNSIIGFYAHATGDILQDDYVTMRGVPATFYSFENVSGGTTNSVVIGVSTLEKTE